MGLDANGTKFLLHAAREGARFDRTAMIGRQGLHLAPEALWANLARFGHATPKAEVRAMFTNGAYAEPFLRVLGGAEIRSFDASDYEHATDVVDLNLPIHPALAEQFTVVLDGGTLEHVFNVPLALRSCMHMVAIGGHFLSITPANNFLGHGFFQFSPELFFRVLSPAFGFSDCRVLLFEDVPNARWYEVTDPDRARTRVTLVNAHPVYLAVMARKVGPTPERLAVQQSDYVAAWRADPVERSAATGARDTGIVRSALSALQLAAADLLGRATNRRLRRQSTRNRRFYREISMP